MVTATNFQQDSQGHLGVLDGFRAFSILAVLAAHMLPLGPSDWLLNTTSALMGMSVFFALSGFLIVRALWTDPDAVNFFVRRIFRIVPLVILVSFLYCIVFTYRPDSFLAVNLYYLNYSSAFFGSISPLWSLCVEMHFYLTIGVLVGVFGRPALWLLPIMAFSITGLRIAFGAEVNIVTHLRVDEILSGGMLALLWVNRETPWADRMLGALSTMFWPLLLLWALSCSPHFPELNYARPYFAAGLVGTLLRRDGGWQVNLLCRPTLRYIAVISFALYVWHSPFRLGWFSPEDPIQRYLFNRPVGIAFTFMLAHASTFYFERPITNAARRWTRRRLLAAEAGR